MTNNSRITVAKACKWLNAHGLKCQPSQNKIITSAGMIVYDENKMLFIVNGESVGYFDGLYKWAETV